MPRLEALLGAQSFEQQFIVFWKHFAEGNSYLKPKVARQGIDSFLSQLEADKNSRDVLTTFPLEPRFEAVRRVLQTAAYGNLDKEQYNQVQRMWQDHRYVMLPEIASQRLTQTVTDIYLAMQYGADVDETLSIYSDAQTQALFACLPEYHIYKERDWNRSPVNDLFYKIAHIDGGNLVRCCVATARQYVNTAAYQVVYLLRTSVMTSIDDLSTAERKNISFEDPHVQKDAWLRKWPPQIKARLQPWIEVFTEEQTRGAIERYVALAGETDTILRNIGVHAWSLADEGKQQQACEWLRYAFSPDAEEWLRSAPRISTYTLGETVVEFNHRTGEQIYCTILANPTEVERRKENKFSWQEPVEELIRHYEQQQNSESKR
jgi:hypothetical protein